MFLPLNYREKHARGNFGTRGVLFELYFWLTEWFDVLQAHHSSIPDIDELICKHTFQHMRSHSAAQKSPDLHDTVQFLQLHGDGQLDLVAFVTALKSQLGNF